MYPPGLCGKSKKYRCPTNFKQESVQDLLRPNEVFSVPKIPKQQVMIMWKHQLQFKRQAGEFSTA